MVAALGVKPDWSVWVSAGRARERQLAKTFTSILPTGLLKDISQQGLWIKELKQLK